MVLDRVARIRKGSEPVARLETLGGDRGVSGGTLFPDDTRGARVCVG
jgi:hypothetical protein